MNSNNQMQSSNQPLRSEPAHRKIGEGSLMAWLRQGAHELSQVLPAFKDSVQVREEPGMFGNPTPQDVAKQTGFDKVRTTEPGRATSRDAVAFEANSQDLEADFEK